MVSKPMRFDRPCQDSRILVGSLCQGQTAGAVIYKWLIRITLQHTREARLVETQMSTIKIKDPYHRIPRFAPSFKQKNGVRHPLLLVLVGFVGESGALHSSSIGIARTICSCSIRKFSKTEAQRAPSISPKGMTAFWNSSSAKVIFTWFNNVTYLRWDQIIWRSV